jgi:hypothetical protein
MEKGMNRCCSARSLSRAHSLSVSNAKFWLCVYVKPEINFSVFFRLMSLLLFSLC